ncbi:MAG: tetratricopeptide repeat protein [Candidatus Sulfotelmatobacter sp.]|jgi:TPR repeat protein
MTSRIRLIWLVVFCATTVAYVLAQDQNPDAIRHKAEAGDPIAQFDLAKLYIDGKLLKKDPGQAIEWLRKSAGQGYVGAEFALGIMYETGVVGLQKDPHEAAKWFLKAAKQQNRAAQDKLSAMLTQGLISAEEANWRAAQPTVSQTSPQTVPPTLPSPPKGAKGKAAPFSLGDVETGLAGGITSKRMATLVQKFGVDFKLSSITRKRLADEGADDNLLATISASKRSL